MISRSWAVRCSDDRLDLLIEGALRARVARACPPEHGWATLMTRLARRDRRLAARREAGLAWLRWALARCFGLVDCVLPLLEMPAVHLHEPRGARIAMHWKWLQLHRVTVRLLC